MAKRLSQRFAQVDLASECLVARFSPDGSMLATGSSDGTVRIVHPRTGAVIYTLPGGSADAMPITALRWRPASGTKTKNVLLAASADGVIKHWHATSQRVLSRISAPDQVYCLDYRADGEQYAAGGKDKAVRVYDDGTGQIVATCRGGGFDIVGHSNRVFSVKYDPSNPHLLASGGWDNTVILWDARTGTSGRSIYGPHICGDALDIRDTLLLTGSWRPDSPLQLFDLRYTARNEPVVDIPWGGGGAAVGSGASAALASRMASRGSQTLIYAACFSPGGTLIAAGGSGGNEAKVFDCRGTLKAALATPPPAAAASATGGDASFLTTTTTGGVGVGGAASTLRSSSFFEAGGLIAAAAAAGGGSSSSAASTSSPGSSATTGSGPLYPVPSLLATVAGLARSVYSVSWDASDGLAVGGGDFLYVFDVNVAAGGAAPGAAVGSAAAAAGGVTTGASPVAGGGAASGVAAGSGAAGHHAAAAAAPAAEVFDGGRTPKRAADASADAGAGDEAASPAHPALAARSGGVPSTAAVGGRGGLSAHEEAAILAAYGGEEDAEADEEEVDTGPSPAADAASASGGVGGITAGVAGMSMALSMVARAVGTESSTSAAPSSGSASASGKKSPVAAGAAAPAGSR